MRANQSAAANRRRAFRLRVAGDLVVAPALHRRSPAAVAELGRYVIMRRIALIILVGLSSLLLLGCPARWKVVFINGSEQPLSVQLSGALDGKQTGFRLPPGTSHSESLEHAQRLAVFGPSGALLFHRDDFGVKDLAPPLQGNYPHIYVLLTTTNVYSIPAAY